MAGNSRTTTENIDEVILRLLNLNVGMELDYQTYFNSIKKRLSIARIAGNPLPQEEDQLLRDELKKIWKIDKSKRFKIKLKKRTINVNGGGNKNDEKKSSSIIKLDPNKFLSIPDLSVKKVDVRDITEPELKPKKDKVKDSIYDILLRISKVLDSILKTITETNKQETKKAEKERIANEEKSRKLKENKLESGGFKEIMGAVKKLMAPFQSIWDRIINFFVNVFLGKVVLKLLNWFGDPKNADKIKSMIRFVKDWWPALLAGYILFGTSFGKGIRSITGIVVKSLFRLTKAIPQILKFIAKNKVAAGAIALFTAGAWVPQLFPGIVNKQEKETDKAPGTKEDKISKLQEKKSNLNFFEDKFQGKGSEIDEQILSLQTGKTKSYGFSGGGYANKRPRSSGFAGGGYASRLKSKFATSSKGNIKKDTVFSGKVSGKKGVDKVPAMLTDGEFVMSVGAVNKYGVENLEAMNAAGGGTNKPKVINGITKAVGGGRIGSGDESNDRGSSNGDNSLKILDDILNYFKSQGIDIGNSKSWGKNIAGVYNQANGYGNQAVQYGKGVYNQGIQYGNQAAKYGKGVYNQGIQYGNQAAKYGKGVYNQAINDPIVKQVIGAGSEIYEKGTGVVKGVQNSVANEGYLSKRGRFEGAAKGQNLNFLSDMLPNAPIFNVANKVMTESYLTKIGMGRNTRNVNKKGENITTAFYGGSSGIDRAHNIGQLQVNKMSNESRDFYLKKVKSGLENGSLKSGDLINAYDLDSKNPIRREQGTVRFFVGPDGSPYLMDTYGFDPGKAGKGSGKVDLGSAQAEYDKQLQAFQNDSKGIKSMGWWAKKFGLKPLADATEGGAKVQFALALRNKIFGYDPEKEALNKLGMRFKTKVQVEELRKFMKPEEIKMMLQLKKDQLSTNERSALQQANKKNELEKTKSKLAEKTSRNQKILQSKRPWWDKMGAFGGTTAQKQRESENLRSTGMAGRYAPGSSQVNIGKTRSQEFLKTNPGTKLYNKPKPNTGTPYRSRFARPKNAGVKPPTPPGRGGRPRVSTVNAGRRGKPSATSRPANSSRPPAFSSTHRRSRGKTLSMSVYGVMM